jgi:transcriptional regulator of acetoin/glycerol metabolism
MKTLISWLAYQNDFIYPEEKSGGTSKSKGKKNVLPQKVDPEGPTMGFHEYFFQEYDRHILLSQEKENDPRLEMLEKTLIEKYPTHLIETRHMGLESVIDILPIKATVEEFMLSFHEREEIDIFISPGTPSMQTAWYLMQLTIGRARQLIQTSNVDTGVKPKIFRSNVRSERLPYMAILAYRSANVGGKIPDFLIPKSLEPIYEYAYNVANAYKVPVLINGETGTGKEHLARSVHDFSSRSKEQFVPINCGAFAESLLESELFGYEGGTFTGAYTEGKPGIFEAAKGGTVFLDEIGDISPKMQVSLLRLLQENNLRRLGSTKTVEIDVRIIAATHKDLYQMCVQGQFRWDLYYRLAVIELSLPSFQEWLIADRVQLIEHIAKRETENLKGTYPLKFDKQALQAMIEYTFPGNVRELENLIKQMVLKSKPLIAYSDLPKFIREPRPEAMQASRAESSFKWKDAEKVLIQKVLKLTNGNKAQAQKLIGYGSINTLNGKMEEYGIQV